MFDAVPVVPRGVRGCSSSFLLLIASAGLVLSTPAFGQGLEEIVVTAQKREQNIQDVGIAISAVTGDQVDRLGFESSIDIARLTPGMGTSATTAGQTSHFTIRGVTQNTFDDHVEAPNAVYIDEGYMAAPQAQVFGLFDLERVEVLKGPQGTLFGRNATGGLVHFITRKPTEEFEAFADLLYGSYDQVRFEGAVSGPLSETVSARVSGMFNRHDEILDNLYPLGQPVNPANGQPLAGAPSGADDFWNDNQWAVRGQLLWEITPDVELLVSGFGARQEISTAPYQSIPTIPVLNAAGNQVDAFIPGPDNVCEAVSAETGACLPIVALDGEVPFGIPGLAAAEDAIRPVPLGDLFGYRDPDGDDFDTSSDYAVDDANEYGVAGATAKLTWNFDAATLTAISHYADFDKIQTLDIDAGPAPQAMAAAGSDTETFTQEVRLNGQTDRARWVAGAYYLYFDTLFEIAFSWAPSSPIATLLTGGAPMDVVSSAALTTHSYSLFGQLDYDLTDRLTLIAGLRGVLEEKDYSYRNALFLNIDDTRIDSHQVPIPTGLEYAPFDDDTSDLLWAGKLQLEFRPHEDWLLYAGVNRGVKAGGFNNKLNDFSPNITPDQIPYEEEILWAYETGFKSTLFDGAAQLNGTFYYYDYQDYQAFVFTRASAVIRNNDANYKGFELELLAQPVDNLDVMLNTSWIDAEVENLEVAPGVFRDVAPAFTPDWQVAGMARYQWPAPVLGGTLALLMDFNYASDRFNNIRNFEAQRMDSYVLANARVNWTSPDQHWDLSFFVQNLTDERYLTTSFDLATLCGCTSTAHGKPRWFGVRARYTF